MRAIALIVVAGCGRVGFDPSADAGTARTWRLRPGPGPGELIGARLAYHAGRHSVILYGGDRGHPPPSDPSDEMWELTAAGWNQLCAACPPGPRYGHGLAYDARRDRLVLFGGASATQLLADTWEWDGATWQQVATTGSAGARRNAVMVDDPARSQIVLVGGTDGVAADDSVHVFDGTTWTLATPAGAGPLRLDGQGMHAAYDSETGRVLVATSENDTNTDDLWAWNGAWSRICTGCTGRARSNVSIIYDPDLRRALLIGGWDHLDEIDGTLVLVDDGWAPVSQLPPRRDSAGAAYDPERETVVLFGGNGGGCLTGAPNCDETWELVPD